MRTGKEGRALPCLTSAGNVHTEKFFAALLMPMNKHEGTMSIDLGGYK